MAVKKKPIEWPTKMVPAENIGQYEEFPAKPNRTVLVDESNTDSPEMVVSVSVRFPLGDPNESGVPLRVRDIFRLAEALEGTGVDKMARVVVGNDERGLVFEVGF